MPGRSQDGCFPGRVSGTALEEDDHSDRYCWRYELSEQVQPDKMSAFYYNYLPEQETQFKWPYLPRTITALEFITFTLSCVLKVL